MANPIRALAWKFVKALVRRQFPDAPSIPIDKLAVWLMGDMSPPVLIDVRQREEYEVSIIQCSAVARVRSYSES